MICVVLLDEGIETDTVGLCDADGGDDKRDGEMSVKSLWGCNVNGEDKRGTGGNEADRGVDSES